MRVRNTSVAVLAGVGAWLVAPGGMPIADVAEGVLVVQAAPRAQPARAPAGERILPARLGEAFVTDRFVREAEWVESYAGSRPPMVVEYALEAPCARAAADGELDEGGTDPRGRAAISVKEAPSVLGTELRVRAAPADALGCGDPSPAFRVILPLPPRTRA